MAIHPPDILAPGVGWFDDWYAIETIAPGITAIGEPLYHQINWNYLIEGETQALLFDTGPGERDISIVVRALTEKPVAALASHVHYDHTGNLHRFENIWAADVPELRACEADGVLHVPDSLHLGSHENRPWQPIHIMRWVKPGETIALGNQNLYVLHTPGHALDEISLYVAGADILFAADFIYPGELYAQLPGSDLAAYLAAAQHLSQTIGPACQILCAHGQTDSAGKHESPKMTPSDLTDLAAALEGLKASGLMPREWPVNRKMKLITWPPAFAAWQS